MTNEKEIREAIREYYQDRYPSAVIRDEFTQNHLMTRNDLFVVDDDIIIAIEIKSSGDNLNRLASQIIEYKTYSSKVCIALDIKHKKKFEREFLNTDLMIGCDLFYYSELNGLDRILLARKGKFPMLYNMMWSSELLTFVGKLKGRSKIGKSADALRNYIECIFTYREIYDISKELFIARNRDWKNVHHKPKLELGVVDMINNKQDAFDAYLKGI